MAGGGYLRGVIVDGGDDAIVGGGYVACRLRTRVY